MSYYCEIHQWYSEGQVCPSCTMTITSTSPRATDSELEAHDKLVQAAALEAIKPDGYAYRYGDNTVRFNHGQSVNGGDPIDVLPYIFVSTIRALANTDLLAEFRKRVIAEYEASK